MTPPERLRSLLFAPADAPRKLERAFASQADLVIVDLEDAVAPDQKAEARRILAEFIASAPRRAWAVRVNGTDTAEHLDDLVATVPLAPTHIMLPKCEGARDVCRLSARLDVLECAHGLGPGSIRILPLVSETARGLQNLDYAQAGSRLAALVFGAEDLSSDLGVTPRDAKGAMTPLIDDARRRIAIAAAAAGVVAIDTPLPDHRDSDAMVRETADAAAMGYGGKLCIHPSQVAIVHQVLAPDTDAILWAEDVITALTAGPGVGVAVVRGRMVDKAHLGLARKILLRRA